MRVEYKPAAYAFILKYIYNSILKMKYYYY